MGENICFPERYTVTNRVAELCLPGHNPWQNIPLKINCFDQGNTEPQASYQS